MQPSKYQALVQEKVGNGESVLLVAPTGLGKTFAVTGDLAAGMRKVIYAVPLRALGCGVQEAISSFRPGDPAFRPVVHHGGLQESSLFSEEVVITTYDQVVAGVPGLPLSLPLRAGHAVAAALLMSRLIFDEAHLAWAISDQALPILFGILGSRSRLGLQSVVLTATLPDDVVAQVADTLHLNPITVGDKDTADDEQLQLREANRHVRVSMLELPLKGKGESKQLDWTRLDSLLLESGGKRIYFGNTVERLQDTWDRLVMAGADANRITVLHNRMPRLQRATAEAEVRTRFGKGGELGDWILLTNQVAEAGLDISAPLVISDPAPVDTLVQRSGRCARWFREGAVEGSFVVIKTPKALLEERTGGLALPYRSKLVLKALETIPSTDLNWKTERAWINEAWGEGPKEAKKQVTRTLEQTAFALNLFDRAAQERRPGEIAEVFREILSIEVGVEELGRERDLPGLLSTRRWPDTSSVSLRQAWCLLRTARGAARAIRYDEGDIRVEPATYVRPGDILIVPSSVAYLHDKKGLCFGDGTTSTSEPVVRQNSEWLPATGSLRNLPREGGRRQSLIEHVRKVMDGTEERLSCSGIYRRALVEVVKAIEPEKDPEALIDAIAHIATLAAAFHDLGKAGEQWQAKARELDPGCPEGLIGRTANTGARIGIPHTPPAYVATVAASRLLLGPLGPAEHLVRAIALAATRHHSSFTDPSRVQYVFQPDPRASGFISEVLERVGAPRHVVESAEAILDAAKQPPAPNDVPLLLPNDDLFPVYAIVGRAILMADREDAAGQELEAWRKGP